MVNLNEFYRWSSGNLLENRTRGAFAEWLVHKAFGIQSQYREEWAPVDATSDGKTYEIKASGYEQSWEQSKPSEIRFQIQQRVADSYIFCLLKGRNPADTTEWTFWVVPTDTLPNQKSIGLKALNALAGEGLNYEALKDLAESLSRREDHYLERFTGPRPPAAGTGVDLAMEESPGHPGFMA